MATKNYLLLFFAWFAYTGLFGQSTNCATATSINLSSGSACVNGTSAGAITDNTLYGSCNSSPVNMVWYTYVANGANNTYTITPGTMTNPEIVIYTGNCPNATGAQLEYCTTATGSNVLTTNWGMTAGQQVWIGVASTSLNDGTFQLCINSTAPAPGPGNTCAQAIPLCSTTFSHPTMSANSSGLKPSCFASAPQHDIFLQFTVTQSGTLAWTATPTVPSTEFDWALWDVTNGCNGTLACCNYNYAAGSNAGFGMQAQTGTVACGYNSVSNSDPKEFCAPIAVTCGKTYVIQISNYTTGSTDGFTLAFTNSTCQISSNATFTVSPTLICGTSLSAVINDGSTGDCSAVWDYGDGSATYTGGTPPNHTYSAPGTYAITETIGGACPSTHTEFVQLLAPLAATVSSTSITCAGQCNGTASLSSVTGGDGVYTYTWSPGGSNANNISSLCAGTYSVTVHNTKCNSSVTQTVNIVAPPPMTVTTSPATICKGKSTPLTASGATTYSWSPSTGLSATTGATVTASPTVTTTYTVIGTTGSCTASATALVTVNPTPTVTVASATICAGNSTTLTGNGASTYTWAPGGSTGSTMTASPASTTIYTITGASAAGCTATATSTITVNPNPTVTVNSPAICSGASAALNATGASTYTWSPSTGLSASTGSTVTASPSSTTSYTITGSSAAGCTTAATSTVTVNPTPTITVASATMCPGNSTTLSASGGNTYTWSPSATLSSSTGATVTASPTVTTTYTITGTAVGGCTATTTATVTIGGNITPTANSATICTGTSATLTATGGTTYTWSPATGLSGTTGSSVTASPTVSTTYTISAASGGCTGTTTAAVTVNPLPTVTVTSPSICPGNSVTVTASGASTYTWSPATGLSSTTGASVTASPSATTTYTVTGATAAGCTATATSIVTVNPLPTVTVNSALICTGGSTTLTANGASTYAWNPSTGLSSASGSTVTASPAATASYTVTGTDANGCSNTAVSTVTVAATPTVTATSDTICAGQQTATLTASGASSYAWSPATGLSSTSGSTVTGTPSSTTVYTVTGSIGTCTATGTTTITVNSLPVVTATSATICVGQQTATLTAGGANTYTWTPSSTLNSASGTPVTATPTLTTSYTVVGTDANGCMNFTTTAVTVNNLPAVTVNSASICANGSATLTANGASTYSWNPSTALSSSSTSSVSANPASTTSYTVTGTDLNGCYSSAVSTVSVISNPTVTVSSATICVGQQTATLTANGATTYSWSPATGLSATSGASVTGTPTATTVYTVTGTASTCTAVASATITVNQLPNVTATTNAPVCVNQSFTVGATGANTYVWAGPNGFTSTQASNTISSATVGDAGTYTVVGTDLNNCYNAATVTVVVNPLPVIVAGGSTVCANQNITLTCNSGTAWTYTWTPPSGSFTSNNQNPVIPNASSVNAGTYTVIVTDGNGCQNAATVNVVVNPLPIVSVNSTSVCSGATATLTAQGANTFAWTGPGLSNTSGASVTTSPSSTTSFTVTGTDQNGCSSSASATVTINPNPPVNLANATSGCVPVCEGIINTFTLTGSYTYNWSFGDGGSGATSVGAHCYQLPGTYYAVLTITDGNQCVGKDSILVGVYPVPTADFNASPQPTTVYDPVINFYNASYGAVITGWNWSFGDPLNSTSSMPNPSFNYLDAGTYVAQLAVVSNYGCTDTVRKTVVVEPEYSLYVPNAFSPNDDGINDVFSAKGEGIKDFKMYIFDRWGTQVFYSEDITKGWDGRYQSRGSEVVQEDVYVWKIVAKTLKNESKQLKGTVTLIK